MAAPAVTTRQSPGGLKLINGHATKIAFERDPDVSLWETEVTPPGIEGGDKIDTTTMFNTTYRTGAPRNLKELTQVQFTAAYDPAIYNQIDNLVNQEGAITVRFPDGSTESFFGYLRSFQPNGNQEGVMPTAQCTVEPTQWDPANDVEAGGALASVSGT